MEITLYHLSILQPPPPRRRFRKYIRTEYDLLPIGRKNEKKKNKPLNVTSSFSLPLRAKRKNKNSVRTLETFFGIDRTQSVQKKHSNWCNTFFASITENRLYSFVMRLFHLRFRCSKHLSKSTDVKLFGCLVVGLDGVQVVLLPTSAWPFSRFASKS